MSNQIAISIVGNKKDMDS